MGPLDPQVVLQRLVDAGALPATPVGGHAVEEVDQVLEGHRIVAGDALLLSSEAGQAQSRRSPPKLAVGPLHVVQDQALVFQADAGVVAPDRLIVRVSRHRIMMPSRRAARASWTGTV